MSRSCGFVYLLKVSTDLIKVGNTTRSFNRRYSEYPLLDVLGVAFTPDAVYTETVIRNEFNIQFTRIKSSEYYSCDPYMAAIRFNAIVADIQQKYTEKTLHYELAGLYPCYIGDDPKLYIPFELIKEKGLSVEQGVPVIKSKGVSYLPAELVDITKKRVRARSDTELLILNM